MNTNKGSLVLKALSPAADTAQLVAYLEKRAKSIPPDTIPSLLKHLPIVLSRNVSEETGRTVVRHLENLGAEAFFIPFHRHRETTAHSSRSGEADRTTNFLEIAQAGTEERTVTHRPWKEIRREFWIIVSMLAIAWLLNTSIASQYLLLGLYTLPAIFSAYFFGRRQAVFTALASILLVILAFHFNPDRFEPFNPAGLGGDNQWYHVLSWGCVLIIIAYTMGTLYERYKSKVLELRQFYQGLLMILRHFIVQDEERENHCFRVSIYATRIATFMGLDKDDVEDIRLAAILHDLSQLKINRSILHKAACLAQKESLPDEEAHQHLCNGPLGRILSILLGDRDIENTADGNRSDDIPLGARILAVADAYDTMTTAWPDSNAMHPQAAKNNIIAGSGTTYDPEVVKAFTHLFNRFEMELPSIL
ncbi:MAG: HD domain-containing protein [Desulfobulbus sp.]|nr:HD domain-containing protein [Desulfobulbus sp.]